MHVQSILIAALVGFTAAAPLESRQLFGGTGSSSSEFSQGGCRAILFAFARGSTEIGNMGSVVGPPTSDGLKREFGRDAVATEGIPYAASLGTNALPGGTDTRSKNGDTQKLQDRDQIPNFPKEKVKIICQPGDAVCRGTLSVLPAHLTYGSRANEGVQFLVQQIKGAQAKIRARNAKREAEKVVAAVEDAGKRVAGEVVV